MRSKRNTRRGRAARWEHRRGGWWRLRGTNLGVSPVGRRFFWRVCGERFTPPTRDEERAIGGFGVAGPFMSRAAAMQAAEHIARARRAAGAV